MTATTMDSKELKSSSSTFCSFDYDTLDGEDGELVEALDAITIDSQPQQEQKVIEEKEKILALAFPLPWGGFAFFDGHLSLEDDELAWSEEYEQHKAHVKGVTYPSFSILELHGVYLRLSNDGTDCSLKITAVTADWEEAHRLRDTFDIPLYTPIPVSVTNESICRATVSVKGDECTWRPLVALLNMLEGRFDPLAEFLERPDTLNDLTEVGKTLAMSVLATKLRGFFCAGVFHIMHADVESHASENLGVLTLTFA